MTLQVRTEISFSKMKSEYVSRRKIDAPLIPHDRIDMSPTATHKYLGFNTYWEILKKKKQKNIKKADKHEKK